MEGDIEHVALGWTIHINWITLQKNISSNSSEEDYLHSVIDE